MFGASSHRLNTNPKVYVIDCLEAYEEYFKRLPCRVNWGQGWQSGRVSKLVKSGKGGQLEFGRVHEALHMSSLEGTHALHSNTTLDVPQR